MNVLFLFSDEHRHDAMGCAGHELVKTPHLDRLAQNGTRFTNAYTTSPICVPARASVATGQYVHNTGCWSNAQAWAGVPQSWGHYLRRDGHRVDSIGKLHYRGKDDDNGFTNEILPLYIRDGTGWVRGLLRNHEAALDCSAYAREIGPGQSSYTDYDLGVTQAACNWLTDAAKTDNEKPWALFVSWLRPHYPLHCPVEFYDLYPLDKMDRAKFTTPKEHSTHEVTKALRRNFDYDRYFDDDTRQVARASYYGLCSFLDYQIGQVLDALTNSGQSDNTLIIYSSDHGDHNGDRGLWTKMTLYDESSRVPLMIAGPDIPKCQTTTTLASLIDIYPTILTAMGVGDDGEKRPGIALQNLAGQAHHSRAVLCEYHDGGSPTGMFMLRTDRWKYNYYPGFAPELFSMTEDSSELHDLAESDNHREVVSRCHQQLTKIVDADAANKQAFDEQARVIDQLGGVDAILRAEEFDFTPVQS